MADNAQQVRVEAVGREGTPGGERLGVDLDDDGVPAALSGVELLGDERGAQAVGMSHALGPAINPELGGELGVTVAVGGVAHDRELRREAEDVSVGWLRCVVRR